MSQFETQFDAIAGPLLDERLADDLVLLVGGKLTAQVPFRGLVERETEAAATTSTRHGRNVNYRATIDVLTAGVVVGVDDAIQLPGGDIAQVINITEANADGTLPRLNCNVPGSVTSKTSQARP